MRFEELARAAGEDLRDWGSRMPLPTLGTSSTPRGIKASLTVVAAAVLMVGIGAITVRPPVGLDQAPAIAPQPSQTLALEEGAAFQPTSQEARDGRAATRLVLPNGTRLQLEPFPT